MVGTAHSVDGTPRDREDQTLRAAGALISRLLFWGATVSLVVLIAGLAAFAHARGVNSPDIIRELERSGPTTAAASDVSRSLADVWLGLQHYEPLAIVAAGIVMLLGLPIASVAVVFVVFVLRRDYRFAAIAFVVLAILVVSLLTSGGGG